VFSVEKTANKRRMFRPEAGYRAAMVTGWKGSTPTILALAAGCVALEAVLVGKIDEQETPVGAVLAAVAALAAVRALIASGRRYEPRAQALLALPRLAIAVVRDAIIVTGVVVRALRGKTPDDRFEEMPLDAGGQDRRTGVARALAVAAASAGPNSVVVDVDPARNVMVVHRLAR
jgi:multisubunit Na+/H+ antiporter MnhE subunit